MDEITSTQGSGLRRDYAATQGPRRDYNQAEAAREYVGPRPAQGPVPNRQIDGSPIGAALAGLEDSSRALHATISRHGDRLELVLHNAPQPGGDTSDKAREPISVLERITAAETLVRIAIGRLEGLTERLLL